MLIKTYGCSIMGISGIIISVECLVASKGNQQMIVGLPGNEVKEGLQRVASAIRNSHCYFPDTKVLINLAPADLKKTSASLDLPMAIAILAASKQISNPQLLKDYLMIGILSLSGTIGKIKGALPASVKAHESGFKGIIVPIENAREAGMVTKLSVYGVNTLSDVIQFLKGQKNIEPVKGDFFVRRPVRLSSKIKSGKISCCRLAMDSSGCKIFHRCCLEWCRTSS